MPTSNHNAGSRFSENQAPNVSPIGDLIYKTGRAIQLTDPQTLPIDIHNTFSRASTATYVDSGVLKYAAIDEVRRQDGIDLLEDAATNLCEQRVNAGAGSPTITENAAIGPDGTMNATEQINTAGGNVTSLSLAPDVQGSGLAGDVYTWSIFAKKGVGTGGDKITINCYGVGATVDNSTFIFSTKAHSGSEFSHIELSDGWFLLYGTVIPNADYSNFLFRIFECGRVKQRDIGDSNYIFGHQLVVGDQVSSFINSQSTRAADIVINENSFLSHFDLVGNEVIQVDNSVNPPATQYIFKDATIQAILSHHEALDTASIANINQKPELLGELGINGSVTGVNIVLDGTDEFYLCSEVSDADVVGARNATIATISDYLAAARLTKLNNGIQTTAFELDDAGVLIATNNVVNSVILYDDSEIDTGLRLNLKESTVVQKISGELQNFDSPLTTEATNMDGSGNTIDFVSPDTFTLHQENFTTVNWKPYLGLSGTFAAGEEYLFIANIVIDSGTAKLRTITYGDPDGNSVVKSYNEILNQGDKKTISVIGNLRSSGSIMVFSFDGTAYAEYDATIKMSVRKILGKSQTIQERVLTTEPKYYVDKVLQAIAPEPPDPSTPLQITNTPIIGYPDTVDQVLMPSKILTYAMTQAEVNDL